MVAFTSASIILYAFRAPPACDLSARSCAAEGSSANRYACAVQPFGTSNLATGFRRLVLSGGHRPQGPVPCPPAPGQPGAHEGGDFDHALPHVIRGSPRGGNHDLPPR